MFEIEKYDNSLEQHCVLQSGQLCDPLLNYSKQTTILNPQLSLFPVEQKIAKPNDIRVVELFAGVGGFRVGLERASSHYCTIWSNQWEPSTKRQDASIVYCSRFGFEGHSNQDIATVPTVEIPECDMLVAGFPCQDYSVATSLKRAGGIEGKKGVLWWQIYRILNEMPNRPSYLLLENVDRLLKSPSTQRGRDFAIILASLNELGYIVEWRVITASEYGMPQRRCRTYMIAYRNDILLSKTIKSPIDWIAKDGVMAEAFPVTQLYGRKSNSFVLNKDIQAVSDGFNKNHKDSPFFNTGIMIDGEVTTIETTPNYDGPKVTLGQILLPDSMVPEDFFISEEDLPKWEYLKGSKKLKRVNAEGYEYDYSEGSMAFPDYLDRPSRTIITGEGGGAPSRFKHIIKTSSGKYRRLTPIELERLNMFPDNHTQGVSDTRRAFLMGNALVTGIVEKIGVSLLNYLQLLNIYNSKT